MYGGMRQLSRIRQFVCLCLFATLAVASSTARAQSTVFFVTDEQGRVGRFDTTTGIGTPLGSLAASGFTAMQVIGLAYDPASNALLLFDRNAQKVYAMNLTTGVATLLFNTTGVSFQGGAVLGGLVYGINESTQVLAAYSFAGVPQTLSGTALPSHTHSLGVIASTGQLFVIAGGTAQVVNTNGTLGAVLLTGIGSPSTSPEDVAFFNGNYLATNYTNLVHLVNASNGTSSVIVNTTQLVAMGVTGSVSGIAVPIGPIPEPATWASLLVGAVVLTVARRRRRA